MKVELEIPKHFEKEARELVEGIKLDELLVKSLERMLEVELKKAILRKIASKSKLTEKDALKIADDVKEGIARRHGLM